MAAFVYEGTLLFGVVMLFGMIYAISTGQRHAMYGRGGLELFIFLALGLYFSWFWSKGGQTLAMKTWRIRLVTASGQPVSQPHAFVRFVASLIWLLPGLGLAYVNKSTHSAWWTIYVPLWILGYALLSRLQPQQQFWHDMLCGTRIIPADAAPAAAS